MILDLSTEINYNNKLISEILEVINNPQPDTKDLIKASENLTIAAQLSAGIHQKLLDQLKLLHKLNTHNSQ